MLDDKARAEATPDPQTIEVPKLLTVKPIAQQLEASISRVYELARDGLIPHVRLGKRQIRFEPRAIAEWIAQGGTAR